MGKFSIGHESIRPTIFLHSYKALGGVIGMDDGIGLALTTLSSMKSTSKLALPRYIKPIVVELWLLETPSHL